MEEVVKRRPGRPPGAKNLPKPQTQNTPVKPGPLNLNENVVVDPNPNSIGTASGSMSGTAYMVGSASYKNLIQIREPGQKIEDKCSGSCGSKEPVELTDEQLWHDAAMALLAGTGSSPSIGIIKQATLAADTYVKLFREKFKK